MEGGIVKPYPAPNESELLCLGPTLWAANLTPASAGSLMGRCGEGVNSSRKTKEV